MSDDLTLFTYDEVTTTMSVAQQLLGEGSSLPFAVLADRQTAGRGSRGSNWASATGNLYVTFVVPPPQEKTSQTLAQGSALPPSLIVGLLVAKLIEESFHLRLTVKWPNDLLLGGRKVGGVLLESSVKDDKWGELAIGIGLNLSSTPELSRDARYAAGSFSEVGFADVHTSLQEPGLREGFCRQFFELWRTHTPADLVHYAARYGLEDDQPWVDEEGVRYLQRGPASDGELSLRSASAHGEAVVALRASRHPYKWIFQTTDRANLYLADVGNSAVKVYGATRDTPLLACCEVRDWSTTDQNGEAGGADFDAFASPRSVIFVASVNHRHLQWLRKSMKAGTLVVLAKRPVAMRLEGYDAVELGIDRLAAMEGALSIAARNKAFVVVSCGTATTIDVVDEGRCHLGGWIIPGLKTALTALSTATELPQLSTDVFEGDEHGSNEHIGLAANTQDAMAGGIINMTVGAIERAVRIARERSAEVEVLLTGGASSILLPAIPRARLQPKLIAWGILQMASGGELLWK